MAVSAPVKVAAVHKHHSVERENGKTIPFRFEDQTKSFRNRNLPQRPLQRNN
jgi:hypothetical protein